MSVEAPPKHPARANPRFALFELGFRPFFLFGALAAIVLMAAWLGTYLGWLAPPAGWSASLWHAHEMVFGVAGAVAAGFLLTAVRNWTSRPTPRGITLAALAALWLLGRVAMGVTGVPQTTAMVIDTAFLPALAIAIGAPIVATRQKHNYQFVIMLIALTLANLAMHLDALGVGTGSARPAMQAAIYTMVWMLAATGGRVIPFFTERRIDGFLVRRRPLIEIGSIATVIALGLSHVWPREDGVTAALAAAAALFHAMRLLGWHTPKLWNVPLLWVLHLAYAWLIVGFAGVALAFAYPALDSAALHALTIGGIAGLMLGMMARVTLGHTGRPLEIGAPAVVAFILLNAGAVLRVLGPVLWPSAYAALIIAAAIFWMLAFGVFAVHFGPSLLLPRVDGRPG